MTTAKPLTDWALIERHYRAGVLSLRQVASEGGVVESAIRKRAKRDGWVRNLNAKIQHRAAELVRKSVVRKTGAHQKSQSEKVIVEDNAQAVSIILIAQKGSIQRSHTLFAGLMSELELTTANRELFEQLGELLDNTSKDEDGKVRQDKLNEIYRKVISMPGRVDAAKKVIEMLEKIVRMEREAFGVDKQDGESNPIDVALKAMADMKRNGIQPG